MYLTTGTEPKLDNISDEFEGQGHKSKVMGMVIRLELCCLAMLISICFLCHCLAKVL